MPAPARVVSDLANSPVDFCSEQPAVAGLVGPHEVGGVTETSICCPISFR